MLILTFLALSLGTDSKIEILDVALIEKMEFNEIVEKLNACMPEGLHIYKAAEPVISILLYLLLNMNKI